MISETRKDIGVAPFSHQRLLSPVMAALRAIWQWRQHQRAIAQLRSLDDRMLKDIGIERSEIIAAVCGIRDETISGPGEVNSPSAGGRSLDRRKARSR